MGNKTATAKIIGLIMSVIFGISLLLLIGIYIFLWILFVVVNRG